ncbi:peptidase M50 [Mycolicibacterium thermoresistibile]
MSAHEVLLFDDRPLPRRLAGLPVCAGPSRDEIDAAAERANRLIVVGTEADLAAVLTRLMRTERLHVEVAHVGGSRWTGWWQARRARSRPARRIPLIRDETGVVIVGSAEWGGAAPGAALHGEGIVDDTVLFDGDVLGVRIEPIATMPGLRASVLNHRGRPVRWVIGRAAQLGTTGARVVRDGVAAPRTVKRSTFYRHTEGWLQVR